MLIFFSRAHVRSGVRFARTCLNIFFMHVCVHALSAYFARACAQALICCKLDLCSSISYQTRILEKKFQI